MFEVINSFKPLVGQVLQTSPINPVKNEKHLYKHKKTTAESKFNSHLADEAVHDGLAVVVSNWMFAVRTES